MFEYDPTDVPCGDCHLVARHRGLTPHHVRRVQQQYGSPIWQKWLAEAQEWQRGQSAPVAEEFPLAA